ncbi:MAG: hypothetical protein EB830_00410 [Nitrosopumilus sp. H13]|nr:MAG: hypothetical protein EB830_00410 [Nitrosopumilus sp. H13]
MADSGLKMGLKYIPYFGGMLKIGLDIGTGFVKCVSDHGRFRFPSLYVRRFHGEWATKPTESVGNRALAFLYSSGASACTPITRGRPDTRYARQVDLLISEAISMVRTAAGRQADSETRIVAGLPYEGIDCRDAILRQVRRSAKTKKCDVVPQAAGTLIGMNRKDGIVVSIGQGTTEIVAIDNNQVIDGESSRWSSEFITRKIGRYAHLDVGLLNKRAAMCKKYAKVLAENLSREIRDMSARHGDSYSLALSGGGLLIPGVREALEASLEGLHISVPPDPVMSNAVGLYKLAG